MLFLETSETTGSQQQKKGEFLIESNLDYVHTNSPARIEGNDPSKPLTYKAPDPLLPSPVSVSQDTTIVTCSKGKQTFPLKVHHPNPDPLQLVGQQVIETFWAVQSTSGLWCDSQGCPMITDCDPRLVTANCALSKCHLKCRRAWTSSVMEPCSLAEPSTFCNRMGWGSGVVSSWCFRTKS